MSAPISSFSKLSINPMQSSRTHPKGKGKATEPEDDSSEDESGEEVEDQESNEEEPDEGTEALYGQRLYAIDHCRHIGSTHYAFQMAYAEVQRYSIRISKTDSAPTCTCKEEGVCRHIIWLMEQIPYSQSGTLTGAASLPYDQISTCGLSNLCESLQWELREGPDSDTEETKWQLKKDYSSGVGGRQTRSMIKQRMKVVRDIMATMSPVAVDDYRGDLFESLESVNNEQVFTKGDIEATVSKLLILDDNIFHQFKNLVPRDVRASDYFAKMAMKAKEACDRLDNFCEVGPADGPYDLIWCAKTLVEIVASISANVSERQPLNPASREAAAKSLVFILGMVVRDRNHDVNVNPNVARRRPHGEPQIDRNLYLRLIGDTRNIPAGPPFVLKALQDLPEALSFVDELEHILQILGSVGWSAPQAYQEKLATLISRLKGSSAGSSPGTASGKRPAGTLDRNAKRMK
jgi:hypothetical protein